MKENIIWSKDDLSSIGVERNTIMLSTALDSANEMLACK